RNLIVRDWEDSEIEEELLPIKELIARNYPEPFNPSTTIWFDSRGFEDYKLEVVNLSGQLVFDKTYDSNNIRREEIQFNGKNLSSGTYLYKISMKNGGEKKLYRGKMTLVK
ncbi:MAG: T9SS type A sorting domain-containing protein, partial [Candidatus Delongbacteria bacterium]|nr:T9SS type A sorting domain-containing protein [Candidatus Delongbacteria bacterium]